MRTAEGRVPAMGLSHQLDVLLAANGQGRMLDVRGVNAHRHRRRHRQVMGGKHSQALPRCRPAPRTLVGTQGGERVAGDESLGAALDVDLQEGREEDGDGRLSPEAVGSVGDARAILG